MTKAVNGKRPRSGDNFAPWKCDAAALERIISAVGSRYRDKIDPDQLVSDLYLARTKWLTFVALDSHKGAKQRRDLFSAVADSAAHFKERLLDKSGDYYVANSIRLSAFSGPSNFDAFLTALNGTIEAATALKEQNSRGGWVRLQRSPTEWFAAEILPGVYERNFRREARVSRRDSSKDGANAAGGPCIRFIHAVMCEMGFQISNNTIARTLKDVRQDRPRRKPRPSTLPRPEGW
jgi:hypothetical protein